MQRTLFILCLTAMLFCSCGQRRAAEETTNNHTMKETDISALSSLDEFKLIGRDWMLITAGTSDSFNTMTASWGGLGILWNKNVATVYVRPSRYTHDFIEKSDRLTLSFFPENCRVALQVCGSRSGRDCDKVAEAGLHPVALESGAMTFSEARLVLDCRKLFKTEMTEENFCDAKVFSQWYNADDGAPHTIYILEIEKVYE